MIFQEDSRIAERPIAWALVGSAVIHALLFWPALASREKAQATAQGSVLLEAYLRPGSFEETGGAVRSPAIPDLAIVPSRLARLRPPMEKIPAIAPTEAVAEFSLRTTGTAAVEANTQPETPASGILPAVPVAVQTVVATARAQTASDGIDAEGLRQFRLDLATQARRGKHYPLAALEAGWRGTAEVRLTVERAGIMGEPELLHSSGFAMLDNAALDMLALAAPRTTIPESLRGRTFSVVLPVVFDLTSQ